MGPNISFFVVVFLGGGGGGGWRKYLDSYWITYRFQWLIYHNQVKGISNWMGAEMFQIEKVYCVVDWGRRGDVP